MGDASGGKERAAKTRGHHESEARLKGISISGGVAYARACLFNENRHGELSPKKVSPEAAEAEAARIAEATRTVLGRIDDVRSRVATEIGEAEAEIFLAQRMIAEDPAVSRRIDEAIRQRNYSAESAIIHVFDEYENRLKRLETEYLRERASDIAEVKRRFLDALGNVTPGLRCEGHGHCRRGHRRVVVARELTPMLTVDLDTESLMGLVTEHGGATSHAGILARSLGVPAVSGIADAVDRISCGTELLVDGDRGEVIVWPSEETVASYPALRGEGRHELEVVAPVPGFAVMANISRSSEAELARRMRAEGIGLYRSEFEFLAEGRILSEDEQEARYRHVLEVMGDAPVFIRLLDLGGDKGAPFLDLPAEANPALGFRGARLLRGRRDLLVAQARAIARASRGRAVSVIYPMIADRQQFVDLKAAFEAAVAGIESGPLRHGVMFEIPSACLAARSILEVADFGSIGTNDLFQYLFALDRDNDLVAEDFDPEQPVFWSLIADLARAGKNAGKPVSICGELAGSSLFVPRIAEAGLRSVSVSARIVSRVREAAKRLSGL